ncbi:MAG TPA: folylpolyglutamate synthase/dihydrofolate synthase family protein, partial [Candidatus Eisenbacteria bacterium]|nr:folylpolyglutamate synthase/dihydrofolate synthase family protein [Candidatus Eisenbacteria bacterium]
MSPGLQQRLERLWGLERRRDKLGLDGTRSLLAALGDPERSFRAVHVAGTNGKGSTAALIERVLREAGHRTGLYTSPHLVEFRERIRVDGRWADDAVLDAILVSLEGAPDAGERTFFEVATALGFAYFARHDVRWAVVEVGLGGRLDTTNVLEPALTVITPVGLDHTEILGATLAAIAREKAGIVKPGVPLVAGPQPDEAREVIAATAREREAPVAWPDARAFTRVALDRGGARFEAGTGAWGPLALAIGLRGRHQLDNAAVALAALERLAQQGVAIAADAVVRGFAAARWPGRLEPCATEPRLWWDGAHNPAGIEALLGAWRDDLRLPAPQAVVLAVARDKDAHAMARAVHAAAPGACVFATRTRSERARPAAE